MEKVTLKFLLKKYPLQVFQYKIYTPKSKWFIGGEHLRINREEKSTLFMWKTNFKSTVFFQKYCFWHPLTYHACYAPSCEKSTHFTRFFGQACVAPRDLLLSAACSFQSHRERRGVFLGLCGYTSAMLMLITLSGCLMPSSHLLLGLPLGL